MPQETIDMMQRDAVIKELIRIVDTVPRMKDKNITLALTGPWGCGKTFILKEMERVLKCRGGTKRSDSGYLVFHYNCWQYDYYDEPLMAIVSVLSAELNKCLPALEKEEKYRVYNGVAVACRVVRNVLVSLLEKKLSMERGALNEVVDGAVDAWKDVDDHIQKNYEFDTLDPFRSAVERTAKALKEAAKTHTIVMVVDELDRCMPSYSIKVMERLHHLFDKLPNCVVILAVDKGQLDRTVKYTFGPRTNTDVYLKKFIHCEFPVATERITGSFRQKYKSYMNLFLLSNAGFCNFDLDDFLADLFRGIDMRTQERIMERLELVHRLCCPEIPQDTLEMLLFELTAAVFMHYEKTHTKECTWALLSEMPLRENNGMCDVIYQDMDCFRRYMQREWRSLRLLHGHRVPLLEFEFPRPEAQCLTACWQLACGTMGADSSWCYVMEHGGTVRKRLVDFIQCLKAHW